MREHLADDTDDTTDASCAAVTAATRQAAEAASEETKRLAEEVKGKTSSIKNLVAGGVGGVCAVLVGQPFDGCVADAFRFLWNTELTPSLSIKVRLQTAPDGAYTGAMDVARKTYAKDGLSGCVRKSGRPSPRLLIAG